MATTDTNQERALDGIRVLDFSRAMAGAVATMLLADYGAEVIMIEAPSGNLLRRGGGHSIWNRGKRSIVLDLDDPAARAEAQALAETADIIVEDHRPGKMAEWGLSYDAVSNINPGVVYTSISGYGQSGPDRHRNSTDAAVAAHLGVMNEWGGAREGPIFLGHPAIGYSTALLATIGTLACLRSRVVTGRGDQVDITMLDGVLSLYPMNWWSEQGGQSIDRKGPMGELRFGRKRLVLRAFECADSRLVQIHTGAAGAFDRAMEVFGLDHEISKTVGPNQMDSLLTDDELDVLDTKLPGIMRTKTVDQWLALLWEHQVAALPIGEPGDALDDDQIRYAGLIAELDDPALGPIEVVGPPVLFSDTPGAISGPAPTLDRDGDEIRSRGWRSDGLAPTTGTDRLQHPLDGVRIVDFATFFASPYGDRLLSDLGAEVVKVEAPDGDPIRALPEPFQGANRGKLGIAANLKDPAALEIVQHLVATADIVHHNLRPGAAERLGMDAVTLSEGRDDLIYHHSPGYGSSGPKSALQSFAPLLSGYVGLFALGAGEGNRPHATFGNEDYYNGLLSACGSLIALVHRERTGRGQYVESPQLHSSLLTISEYYKQDGNYRSAIPRLGRDLYGWAAGYRLYQALDAWICVTCLHDDEVAALARAVVPAERLAEFPDLDFRADSPPVGPLAGLLEYHFVERPADEWIDLLTVAGARVERVREDSWLTHDAFHEPPLIETGQIVELDHPAYGRANIVGDLVRPRVHQAARRGRGPLPAEHTIELLGGLGIERDRIEHLAATGALQLPAPD